MNKDLHALLLEELRDLKSAEEQITKALPTIIKLVTHEELKNALTQHLEETKNQLERFTAMEEEMETIESKHCAGMEAILKEGEVMVKKPEDSTVIDIAIALAAQKVEHYEISGYTAAILMAQQMNHTVVAELLEDTLTEEAESLELLGHVLDDLLTQVDTT